MKLFTRLKNLFEKTKPKQVFTRCYILENEIKIPIILRDECGGETNYSYSYGYENGWLKICLWGGSAYKKMVNEDEVEQIIGPIRDLNLNEHQTFKYLQMIGGFEPWDYYTEYYKRETIYL